MKISIITPVKNLEKYISETIESVLNQRGDFELEYIIIDGKSADTTLEICDKYQSQILSQTRAIFCNSIDFKIVSSQDNSIYDALAKGLQSATGDIISYINGDDFYLPNAFSCVIEIFSKYDKINWLSGLPVRYNEQGIIINFCFPWQYNSSLILKGFYGKKLPFIQQESVFWRRELNYSIDFGKLKHYKLAGDYFLWHSFARQQTQLYIVDSFLSGNRLRKGQLSENKEGYYEEFDRILSKANILDYIKVFFYWIMEKFAGKPIKRRLSRNRVSYKRGNWILK